MNIQDAITATLVDVTSGIALGKVSQAGIDLDTVAGNTEVVRAKLSLMHEFGIKGEIKDTFIALNSQYHLIRPSGSDSFVFLRRRD